MSRFSHGTPRAPYNGPMDRIIDEIVLLGLGIPLLLLAPAAPATVAVLLVAVVVTGLLELLDGRIFPGARAAGFALVGAFLVAGLALPSAAAFVPLAAYNAAAFSLGPLRFAWPAALAGAIASGDRTLAVAALLLGALACLMAWRTRSHRAERASLQRMRDAVQEDRLALAARTRDLSERQDLEVNCAVLDERARIAREIHDNVGHLLTRSVLQVEALAVVHGDDGALGADLKTVGATLHDALHSVRSSVHNLHDDAFDPRTALEGVLGECPGLAGSLTFEATALPRPVGLAVLAMVREALSNARSHGNATAAAVAVVEFPGFYQLTVEDNGRRPVEGRGRAADEANRRGLGLTSMEERVGALGGTFSCGPLPAPRTGWRVFATFPKEQEVRP